MTIRTTALRVAGWTAAGALAIGTATGVGVAFASSPASTSASPTTSPSSTTSPAAHKPPASKVRRDRTWLGVAASRLQHGQFVVTDKKGADATVLVQHGAVSAVSSTSISLRSADGFTASYTIDAGTRVRVDGSKAALSGVQDGNQAWVTARQSGGTATATVVVDRTK